MIMKIIPELQKTTTTNILYKETHTIIYLKHSYFID